MPELQVPKGISVNRQRVATPQVNVSVTPEQLAGPEVRLLQDLGKSADEITDFVVRRQNTKDLEIVTRADTAMKELLMEQKLAAEKLKGMDASGLLTKQTTLFDGNFHPEDGQVLTEAHQRYLNVYQSADQRQQAAMDLQRGKQRITHLKAMGSYEEAQTSAAALDAHKANVQISVAKGIAGTEEERDAEMSSIHSQYNSIKALTGAKPETIMADQMKDFSAIHMGRLKNLVDAKDIVGAEKYFEKYKDEMIGDTSTIKNAIATSKEDILAEAAADGAKSLRKQNKRIKAEELLDSLSPSIQKKAREQYNTDLKMEEARRKETQYQTNLLVNRAVYEKTDDGEWKFNKYTDLPAVLRAEMEANNLVEGFKKGMSTRNDPIAPSTASQAKAVNLLTALQFGSREEQMQFATFPLVGLGLDTENYQAFAKAQQEILHPTPGSKGKADYLASAIKRSNFDSTNEGHMEVQGQLVMEVIKSVAAGEGKTDAKAAGDLSFDEYRKMVDKLFNPGKVSTMKKANSRPKPSTDKGKTFGTPAALAKRYLEMRGSDHFNTGKKYVAAWEDSVSKYASQYFQDNKEYAPNAALDRFMQFAEKNVVQHEEGGTVFGAGPRVLSQVPEIERNEKVYEIVDGEKYTYGEVNGVGLPANKQKRLAGQIKEYLQQNKLPPYFKNKAAAYHSIHRADTKAKAEAARVQRENKILSGKTKAGEDKRQLFDSAMRNSYSALQEFRDNKWEGMAPDTLAIIDLALEKKKRGARR